MRPDSEEWVIKEHKNYNYHLPNFYKMKDKDGSYIRDRKIEEEPNQNVDTFEIIIMDMVPVDFMDKMPDERSLIQEFCEAVAFSRVEPKEKNLIISSRAYVKKKNPIQDTSAWQGWTVQLRKAKSDLFVTILRRKYIPPLIDIYQDIILISTYNFTRKDYEAETAESRRFYNTVHHKIADSIHSSSRSLQENYNVLIEEKANGLLMDEQTMDFFIHQLRI